MCLLLEKSDDAVLEPKIALEDIICYKTAEISKGGNSYTSPYYYYNYSLGSDNTLYNTQAKRFLNPTKDFWGIKNGDVVEVGFHSFVIHSDAISHNENWWFSRDKQFLRVLECVIPKGSRYWEGKWADDKKTPNYCSDRIIVKREI